MCPSRTAFMRSQDMFCCCCCRCCWFVEKNTCPYTQESIVKMLWHLLTIGKLAFIVCMNVYLYCNPEEIPCSHFPRLCPLFISNGVDFHCGQKMLVHDVQSADQPRVRHDAPSRGHEYSGKPSTCSDNKLFWIRYRWTQAIFQAVSCCWKVHPWLILGSHTCICFSSREVCLLPESLIPPGCLRHTRPGPTQHKPQRNVQFFYIVFFLMCP